MLIIFLSLSVWTLSYELYYFVTVELGTKSSILFSVVDGRMVFFIKSAFYKTNIREFIRRTWAQLSYVDGFQCSIVFLVGRANTKKKQSLLDEEYARYQDILQMNISDGYRWEKLYLGL